MNIEMMEQKKKSWLIYPHDERKMIWDVLIITLLLYTATYFVYSTCFYDKYSKGEFIFNNMVDVCFFIDIIVTFFTVFEEEKGKLNTSRS